MGWAYGINADGREVGYAFEATCDQKGCETKINRGLAYVCGGMHDGDDGYGCGGYFCYSHLFMGGPRQMCRPCQDAYFASDEHEHDWRDDDLCDECGATRAPAPTTSEGEEA